MLRTIATTLALALLACPALMLAQQDRAQAGSPAADRDKADAAQSDAQRAESSAVAGEARAEAAAARADQAGEKDPAAAFVKETYSANLFEIKASEWAAQKAQDNEVKQFARTMVDEHTKANQQLKQVAQSKQIQLDEQLSEICQLKLAKMAKCAPDQIDRKYINGQAAGHMMAVLEFRYQSKNQPDPQLKQWASTALPKLEEHLKEASLIANRQAGGDARTVGERIRGVDADQGAGASDQGAGRSNTENQSDAAQGTTTPQNQE